MKGEVMPAIAIDIPEDLALRLQALTERTGRSETSYVLEAVNEYLEDFEDVQIAEERLADIRSGRSRTYTLEEVERELGLAD
jgi:RHH-type rel operon transcriptional repressor/antitoxin RelB